MFNTFPYTLEPRNVMEPRGEPIVHAITNPTGLAERR